MSDENGTLPEYIIGQAYYSLGYASVAEGGEPQPVVNTWRYDGIERLVANSKLCDVPNHFLAFTLVTGNIGAASPNPERIYIPSRAQANLTRLAWPEFRRAVIEMNEDGFALA